MSLKNQNKITIVDDDQQQEDEVSDGSNDHLDSDGSVIVYNNEPDRLKKKTKKDLKRKVSTFINLV